MAEKSELKQKVIGVGFEKDLIVKSQRGRTYTVKLSEDIEVDANELLNKGSDETVWATIDTDADPWVVVEVEIVGE